MRRIDIDFIRWIGPLACLSLWSCAASKKELAHPAVPLPQLVRFFSITKVRQTPGALFITGGASAAADGGKYDVVKRSPLSSYPLIEMTIQNTDVGVLAACKQRVQAASDNHQSIDIRGMGTYVLHSMIDPPLDTHTFTLIKLDACGADTTTAPVPLAIPAISSGTVPAADLVAVPERYLNHQRVVSGHSTSAVHFRDPVSNMIIEDEGQSLIGYFFTQSLSAENRLALVHAAPGSILVLEGTLTRTTPKSLAAQSDTTGPSGYEFDVSNVMFVGPAK